MGYHIQYGTTMVKSVVHNSFPRRKKFRFYIVLFLCAVLIAVGLCCDSKSIRDFILPGNAEVTQTALNNMVCDIKEGQSLGDAVIAFCQNIVENANIPG